MKLEPAKYCGERIARAPPGTGAAWSPYGNKNDREGSATMSPGTMIQLNFFLTAYVVRGDGFLELRIVNGRGGEAYAIAMSEIEAARLAEFIRSK